MPVTTTADPLDSDASCPDPTGDPALCAIAEVLATVRRAGSFCASGQHPAPLGALEIDGFGPLPLPLIPAVVADLLPLATPAPYGRGGATLHDPDVRRCHQVAAERILAGPGWQATLDTVVAAAAAGLGVDGPVRATLYKLLLYGPGDFFLPHRDSEKEDGMLGTLVVVLPARFTGGQLVVTHGDDTRTLPLQPAGPDQLCWAAFYADCLHEIRPLQDGVRAVLVYNLSRQGPVLRPPDLDPAVQALGRRLRDWEHDGAPAKLCYVLEHRYTPAELGWDRLKGVDQARSRALAQAAVQTGMTVHLAMISLEEHWSAQETWGWGRRHSAEPEPDEVELYDLFDAHRCVEQWRSLEGTPVGLPHLGFEDEEIVPEGALIDLEPDEFCYHEATGNEGATVERTYRRAAVVVWPPSHEIAVLAQGGSPVLLAALDGCPDDQPDRAEALARAAAVARGPYVSQDQARLLDHIARRGLHRALRVWIGARVDHGSPHADPAVIDPALAAPLARALDGVEADQAATLLASLVPVSLRHLEPAIFLVGTVGDHSAHPRATWAPAVARLLAAAMAAEAPDAPRWDRPAPLSAGALAVLLDLVLALHPARSGDLLAALTAPPGRVDLDRALAPAVVAAVRRHGRVAALDPWTRHLRAAIGPRLARPLDPPLDLRRAPPRGCRCEHCRRVAAFMDDPARDTLHIKAAEHIREHVQKIVQHQGLDLRATTLRSGRPYTLVLQKTLASYEAAVRQRQRDLEIWRVVGE